MINKNSLLVSMTFVRNIPYVIPLALCEYTVLDKRKKCTLIFCWLYGKSNSYNPWNGIFVICTKTSEGTFFEKYVE
jgi:hypothetical protein